MKWNKITLERTKINFSNNNPFYLEIDNEIKLDIVVSENTKTRLIILGNNNYDLKIKLEKNSQLIVNSLNKDNAVNISVYLMEKASITYNHSVLACNDSINRFNIYHLEDDSISNLNNNGINLGKNKLFFIINGEITKKLHSITCNQTSKIINYDCGYSQIVPNLIIDSQDILASHSAYIGKIDDDEKFYMESRGINYPNIQKLIYEATLLKTMDLKDEKEEFYKRINEWW